MLPWLRDQPLFLGLALDRGDHTFALLGLDAHSKASLARAFARRGHPAIGAELRHVDLSCPIEVSAVR